LSLAPQAVGHILIGACRVDQLKNIKAEKKKTFAAESVHRFRCEGQKNNRPLFHFSWAEDSWWAVKSELQPGQEVASNTHNLQTDSSPVNCRVGQFLKSIRAMNFCGGGLFLPARVHIIPVGGRWGYISMQANIFRGGQKNL
jgi:hypothetical protein